MSIGEALTALADWTTFTLMTAGSDPIRLKAAQEVNRIAGRYKDQVNASDLTSILTALASKSMPDQALNELESIVDLTAPTDRQEAD